MLRADVTFYRTAEAIRYRHIDKLFDREIDWGLIATHWPDMMQVVLSILAGLIGAGAEWSRSDAGFHFACRGSDVVSGEGDVIPATR